METRGESGPTGFLSQYDLHYFLKLIFIPADKCSSYPSSKKRLFAVNREMIIRENLNGFSCCDERIVESGFLQLIHLQHNSCTKAHKSSWKK